MITAIDARALAGPSPQERVNALDDDIRKAAIAGKRKITLHGKFWAGEGYSSTDDYKEACNILAKLGFKVSFFYEEKLFVNMYTVVEW